MLVLFYFVCLVCCLFDWLLGWLSNQFIFWFVDWLNGWLFDWFIGWFDNWLIDRFLIWFVDWLVVWLAGLFQRPGQYTSPQHYNPKCELLRNKAMFILPGWNDLILHLSLEICCESFNFLSCPFLSALIKMMFFAVIVDQNDAHKKASNAHACHFSG